MKILTMFMLALMLGACSGGDAPATSAPATTAPAKGTVSEGNVFKTDVDALAKAKGAEKIVLDAAEQQRKDVDANQ